MRPFKLTLVQDDCVFEDSVDQPQTSESQSKENNDITNEIETDGSDKTETDSRQIDDESALTVENTTLDTTLADKIDPGDTGNSVTEANVADRAGFKDKIHEQLVNRTDVKAIPTNKSKKPKDNLLKLIDTLTSPLSENGTSELPAKKVTISQDTHKPPQASYLRQESDLFSSFSSEFESKNVNNPEEIYRYTGFPSLFSYLGPNATNKTLKDKKKKHVSRFEMCDFISFSFLSDFSCICRKYISMGKSNTVVSVYTTYRHLQQYCSHPSICRM